MPTNPDPNTAALAMSIRDRLLNLARQPECRATYNALLRRYLQERLLWRLSQSRHREQFILKGALRLVCAGFPWARVTKDIDLLGYGDPEPAHLVEVFREVCRAEPSDAEHALIDAVRFDPDSITASPILEGAEYGGVRVSLVAFFGNAREPLQIDIGFGDAVTPPPTEAELPTLLSGMPAPRLRVYNDETTVAEKLHTMVKQGAINSRVKDFYDLYRFATSVAFDGALLAEAVRRTFERRGTPFEPSHPVFNLQFATEFNRQSAWNALRRSLGSAAEEVPEDLTDVVITIQRLAAPLYEACGEDRFFTGRWNPILAIWEPNAGAKTSG